MLVLSIILYGEVPLQVDFKLTLLCQKRVFLTYTLDVKALSLSLETINTQLEKVLA